MEGTVQSNVFAAQAGRTIVFVKRRSQTLKTDAAPPGGGRADLLARSPLDRRELH